MCRFVAPGGIDGAIRATEGVTAAYRTTLTLRGIYFSNSMCISNVFCHVQVT